MVRVAWALVAGLLGTFGAASAGAACRLALVLALDVSGSVDQREYRLQLDGIAAALETPDLRAAVLAMPGAPVRLHVFEWSAASHHRTLVPWVALTSGDNLDRIAQTLRRTTRTPAPDGTALGAALAEGVARLTTQRCWRGVLDISSDGKNNQGPQPQGPRDRAAPFTINALAIGADARAGDERQAGISELSAYFNAHVITGPDAFVQVALGYDDYRRAMTAKLLREIGTLAVGSLPRPPGSIRSQ